MKTIKVSASEALSTACWRKWMYSFHPGYNLESITTGLAIQRGLIGHEALEIFYSNFMKGTHPDECKKLVDTWLLETSMKAMMDSDMQVVQIVTELVPILNKYWQSAQHKNLLSKAVILGVEVGFEVYLDDTIILPGRLDLLVKWTEGPFNGETNAVDHKFVYNFWSDNALSLNAQMPGYTHLIKENMPGVSCGRGVINQIRHRSDAVESFKLTDISTPRKLITGVLDNHLSIAHEIAVKKAMPLEEIKRKATRTISKFNCENCSFLRLCKTELAGDDATSIIKHEYRANSYGYGNVEDETS